MYKLIYLNIKTKILTTLKLNNTTSKILQQPYIIVKIKLSMLKIFNTRSKKNKYNCLNQL